MEERLRFNNAFESLGLSQEESADMEFRSDIISALVDLFEDRGWKQADIAAALAIPQPRVSDLVRGKVHIFSANRLIGYLAKLNVRLKPSFKDGQIVCRAVDVIES